MWNCFARRQTTNTGRTAKQVGERLEALLLKASKTGKLPLVDIAWFLTLQVGHASGGWFCKDDIASNIVDKLIGELPDSSATGNGFCGRSIFFLLDFCRSRLE